MRNLLCQLGLERRECDIIEDWATLVAIDYYCILGHCVNLPAMVTSKILTIIYKRAGKLDISLDLILPPNAKEVPVLLWFHGGGLLYVHDERITENLNTQKPLLI